MKEMKILFTVLGNPQALKRHRTVFVGKAKNVRLEYDPSKNDKADFLAKAMLSAPPKPLEGAIELHCHFFMPRPKCHYHTGKNAGVLRNTAPQFHISRPDIDNLEKFVVDALTGIFWKDDSQIWHSRNFKFYDERPRVEIEIFAQDIILRKERNDETRPMVG